MTEKEKETLTTKITKEIHKHSLKIPTLKGYSIVKSQNDSVILLAKAEDNSILEFIEDKKLKDNENFEERVKEIIEETKNILQENGFTATSTFLKDYQGKTLNFKLYKLDNILENKQVRQINAYFIEPESKFVYLIALASPPLKKDDVNDFVTQNLMQRIEEVLLNIEYNDQRPF